MSIQLDPHCLAQNVNSVPARTSLGYEFNIPPTFNIPKGLCAPVSRVLVFRVIAYHVLFCFLEAESSDMERFGAVTSDDPEYAPSPKAYIVRNLGQKTLSNNRLLGGTLMLRVRPRTSGSRTSLRGLCCVS